MVNTTPIVTARARRLRSSKKLARCTMDCRVGSGLRVLTVPHTVVPSRRSRYGQSLEAFPVMFELETLAAFCLGAGLMALVPALSAVAGKDSKLTTAVSTTGRSITKQGLKVGLVVADKTSGVVKSVGRGLAEVGESFSDVMAEAKADLAKPDTTSSTPETSV